MLSREAMGRTFTLLLLLASATLAGSRAQPADTPGSVVHRAAAPLAAAPTPPAAGAIVQVQHLAVGPAATHRAYSRSTDSTGVFWLSLDQAMLVAMSNSDVVRTLDGGVVSLPPVTSYDPAIAEQRVREALAAFDTSYSAEFFWSRFEGPPESFFGPGIERASRFDQGTFRTGLTKLWTPGTQTRVFYDPSPGYLFYPNGSSTFNPTHVAAMELSVRQPLLQGAGVAVNEAPIRIAQLRTDQTAWQFKQALLEFVRSVQQAYWELQAARIAVEVIERQIPLIDEVVRVEQANVEAHRAVKADLAKARSEQRSLRGQLAEAHMRARESELRLRNILGLSADDQRALVLTTPPLRAPLVVDTVAAMDLAVNERPELISQRIRTRINEVELLVAENRYRPQLDVQALYRANGLFDDLSQALEMMGRQNYYDWEFGAIFSVPLGRNAARARVRAAEWELQRNRALLRESIQLTEYQLDEIAVRIASIYAQHQEAEARVRDADEWLRGARIRFENPPPAGRNENWLLLALDDYLFAMRASADAAVEASQLLAQYNTELARLEEVQGTLLRTFNIELSNDPCKSPAVRKLLTSEPPATERREPTPAPAVEQPPAEMLPVPPTAANPIERLPPTILLR